MRRGATEPSRQAQGQSPSSSDSIIPSSNTMSFGGVELVARAGLDVPAGPHTAITDTEFGKPSQPPPPYDRDETPPTTTSEQMMALIDLQTFAKAYGYKVVVANAFNQRFEGIKQYLENNVGSLVNKFDWSTYVHNKTPYVAFVQKLVELDGLLDPKDWGAFHSLYHKRDYPATYLTNCEGAHPTLAGYKVIADELAKFINTQV